MIIILQIGYVLVEQSLDWQLENSLTVDREIQAKILALQREDSIKNLRSFKPFNPNYITDFKGFRLGMSPAEIDRLHSFRAKGNFVNSTKEFQKVTGVSDALIENVSPFFTFPDFHSKPNLKMLGSDSKSVNIPIDINLATADSFRQINGIGPVLSKRLVRFRNSLGGFRSGREVYDVYGVSPEVAKRILKEFKVVTPAAGPLLNVNHAREDQLRQFGYFSWELAYELVAYRVQNGPFKSLEHLKKVPGFPVDKFERIRLYLTL